MDNVHVYLVPPLKVGFGGWCLVEGSEGFACSGYGLTRPLVAQKFATAQLQPHAQERAVGAIVTEPDAATITVFGRVLQTTPQPGLPDHLRGVAYEAWYPESESRHWIDQSLALRSRDRQGRELPISHGGVPGLLINTHAQPIDWRRPHRPPAGPCEITFHPLEDYAVRGGVNSRHVRPYRDAIGQALQACANTSIENEETQETLLAAVLVNSAHPGARPPALLSGKPVPGMRGVYESPGSEGPFLARREGSAWLAVQGGNKEQRSEVLKAMRANVYL